MKPEENDIETILARHLPSASPEEVEEDCNRILQRLQAGTLTANRARLADLAGHWRRLAWISVAAGLLVAAATLPVWVRQRAVTPFATVENAASGLFRVAGSKHETLRVSEKLSAGETVRSNGGSGAMIRLADGSLIEMRSQSELSLQRANDGSEIRLNSGGVIVNAAKQRTGHLYVLTKDVRVSVIGTVFMVNAEEQGSRVAVIEGEVHVQQGATEKKLRPGEQVATNPKMESLPLTEEIAWSKYAEVHSALLQQSLAQNPPEEQASFEVISIRSAASAPAGGGRGGGGGTAGPPPLSGCFGGRVQFDPGRFVFRSATVYSMIAWAYESESCGLISAAQRIIGGPPWVKSDAFDIEATIPTGVSNSTSDRFGMSRPPKLQAMLRALLADRFKLTVHRESRDVPIYALTVAKGGPKLQPSTDASCVSPDDVMTERKSSCGASSVRVSAVDQAFVQAFKMNLDQFSHLLILGLDRPIVNRTDLPGYFDLRLEFAPDRGMLQNMPVGAGLAITGPISIREGPPPPSGSSIFTAVQEQLGLKLDATTGPVEFLVIDRVEKPTEN